MQGFIVLGLVPGTNIQLTFNFWLSIAVLALCLPFLAAAWRRRKQVMVYLAARRIAQVIDQYQVLA